MNRESIVIFYCSNDLRSGRLLSRSDPSAVDQTRCVGCCPPDSSAAIQIQTVNCAPDPILRLLSRFNPSAVVHPIPRLLSRSSRNCSPGPILRLLSKSAAPLCNGNRKNVLDSISRSYHALALLAEEECLIFMCSFSFKYYRFCLDEVVACSRRRSKGVSHQEIKCEKVEVEDPIPPVLSTYKKNRNMGNTLDSTVFQPPKQSRYTDIPQRAKIWLTTKQERKIA